MKRIATIGAILTTAAIAAPSVAAGGNVAQVTPQISQQISAQVIGTQVSTVQRAKAAMTVQRHLVQVAQGKRFSLLVRAQIR